MPIPPPRHLRPDPPAPRARRRRPSRARILGALAVVALVGAAIVPIRATALRQGQAVWSVKCEISHSLPDDPIVFSAQPGRSHLHDFFGNVSVKADTSSTKSLLAAASTCQNGMDQVDKAAYWTPALLHNGRPVGGGPGEHRIDAYYSVSNTPMPVRPMPLGLRMIAGDAAARSPQPTDIVHYNCLRHPQGGQVTGSSAAIPSCPGGTYLSAKIIFPSCWDGRNLDSPDHKSHMAYPAKGRCPVGHPVSLPTLGIRLRWKQATSIPSSQLELSSAGQFSMHADFWNAWNPAVMQWLVDNCLNNTRNCTDIARTLVKA